jgi:hypothetical protein
MASTRSEHTATTLVDGRMFIAGGSGNNQATSWQVYDPATASFTLGGTLSEPRGAHTATRLADGRVLIAGGYRTSAAGLAQHVEIFDPTANAVTALTPTIETRRSHGAALLNSGKVLLVGGLDDVNFSKSTTMVVDPTTGDGTAAGDLSSARGFGTTATHLSDDSVLVAGGCCTSQTAWYAAELFRPANDVYPAGTANVFYTATVAGFGTAPNAFTIVLGTLPAGLGVNGNSGVISGTPGAASTTRLVIKVTDSSSPAKFILREVTIVIRP